MLSPKNGQVSNLQKRTIYGAVYVLVMLAGTILHPISFVLIFSAVLVFTQFEFYAMVEQAGHRPSKWVGTVAGLLFFLISFGLASNLLPKQLGFSFIPIILFMLIFEIFSSDKNTLENSGLSVLGFIYIAAPFSLMNFIAHSSMDGNVNTFYPWILVGVYLIIWTNDSFAYLLGTAFGKHRLFERISPKKSWEGFIGGAVFAIVMGIVNAVLFQSLSMLSWIVIAVLTVCFGTLGDLFQSKLKREIGVKDSGTILPGHGGFLDRLDSLLFVIPAVFIWLIFAGNI